ncbi:hypothetical protein MCEMAEM21_01399 [Oxalobacteraceae bacterium]|jgi:hypothetical protein
MKVFYLFTEIIAKLTTPQGASHDGKKLNPPHLHVAGSGLLSLFRRQIFLVMRAHDADELKPCHHASHQRAKGLICMDFFQTNK